jgi:flagellar biosynthesis GTPase FlhF
MATQAITPIDTAPIENKLALLKARAEAIVVTDQDGYIAACQIAVEVRAEVKAIGFALDPGIDSAKRHLDELRNQKKAFVDRLTPIVDIATRKAETWKAEERRLAQAEQDRINAELRKKAEEKAAEERKAAEEKAEADRKARQKEIEKQQKAGEVGKREAERLKKEAAEQEARDKELAAKQARETAANVQEVHVQAAVPKVAGVRARVNPKWKMVDIDKVPREYLYPNDIAATENFPRITTEVRKSREGETFQQRKTRLEATIPGIEYFEQDAV